VIRSAPHEHQPLLVDRRRRTGCKLAAVGFFIARDLLEKPVDLLLLFFGDLL
jgi:hypothetical protein